MVFSNLQDGLAPVAVKLIAQLAAKRLEYCSKNRFVQLVEGNYAGKEFQWQAIQVQLNTEAFQEL